MDIEKEVKKMTLGHEFGAGASCLKCKDKCEGFELHFWRSICRNCKCGLTEHDVQMESEEDKKVGKLFEDTKYTGQPSALALAFSISISNSAGKSVTFEWAPPVANKHVAIRYIELLPPERRPIAGTPGAAYRRQQMAKQLPEHDQDPNKCHDLSPAEVKQMQQYVRKYKDEALGVGDVCLPQEVAQAAGRGELGGGVGPGGAGAGTCHQCRGPMRVGDPAVYAERAGYDKMWHPACFVCVTCQELLVDMIYFWKKGKMFCGRHYGDSEKPRCAGCDELIFSNEYTQAEGHDWHLKHFCCFECDCVLAGETYVMEEEKPVCKPCYMKNYAMKCSSCQSPIEPEAQRVSYGAHCWHAQPECFQCSGCSQCLMGKRFMAVQNHLFCSVECKKKIIT
uniref:Uncharacterized protein n=1 Tax=Periophthalmus magnuspinnatus TaxID=409849 RepID=A0A3B4AH25_9GOBI